MNLDFESNRPELLHTLEDVIRIFMPGVKFASINASAKLRIHVESNEDIQVLAQLINNNCLEEKIREGYHQDEEPDNQEAPCTFSCLSITSEKTGGPGHFGGTTGSDRQNCASLVDQAELCRGKNLIH